MLCCCADVHLGNHRRAGGQVQAGMNDRCRDVARVFDQAVEHAISQKADLIVAGDLLDVTKPYPQQLAVLQASLLRHRKAKLRAFLLVGNHEQVTTGPNDHALVPLQHHATVVAKAQTIQLNAQHRLVMLPASPHAAADWVPDCLERLVVWSDSVPTTLVLHCGIEDDSTPPWLKGAHDSIRADLLFDCMDRHKIDVVLAGNWHEHQTWSRDGMQIVQCGALCPTGWDNEGVDPYGRVIELDRDRPASHVTSHVVPGPRFITVESDDVDDGSEGWLLRFYSNQHHMFVRWKVPHRWLRDATEIANLRSMDDFTVVVEPTRDELNLATRQAATAARSAAGFDAALGRYIDEMPLPEGVDRVAVRARSEQYACTKS